MSAYLGDYDESLDWGRQLLETAAAEQVGLGADPALEGPDRDRGRGRPRERAHLDRPAGGHATCSCTSILHTLGRTPEALEHVRDAIALEPDRAELYAQRAQLSSEIGRFQDAIGDLDRFLRISDKPFEHPDVRRAYELRTHCEGELAQAAARGE